MDKDKSSGIKQLDMAEYSGNTGFALSQEQELFIQKVKEGNNVLVDACIGSGKTTAIQYLCDELPENLKVLYLTYNRLLKIDARSKIKNTNVTVTNYHGFAAMVLRKNGVRVGVSDLIQYFNQEKPKLEHIDVLIIDEYQDIEQELADLLEHIKASNPKMQIVAVGDMDQKIYDKTTLNVPEFIKQFLGEHIRLEFTNCFRLSAGLAEKLGRIWGKKICGVNDGCIVEKMNTQQAVDFLSGQLPKDILCLGSREFDLSIALNVLESKYPEKFNKKTVYASIYDRDNSGKTDPKKDSAIFTTFDSSKGLERKICVVFDYTEGYWQSRIRKPMQSYEILRNIFCVAASRGKERIIFVDNGQGILSEETLSDKVKENTHFNNVNISDMFDFKYKENIEECFSLLKIAQRPMSDNSAIYIKNNDELIDLSPCIGIYQEAVFFSKYNIDKDIELHFIINNNIKTKYTNEMKNTLSLNDKILFLTSLETKQDRYRIQVKSPFVKEADKERILERLGSVFSRDENAQVSCSIDFSDEKGERTLFSAIGLADVVKDDLVYELKFVSELTHEHFLQCACYVAALGLEKGVLWNTRNNTMYEITIPNKSEFLDAVVKAITKTTYTKYHKPANKVSSSEPAASTECIAVIDTETNWENKVMSVGVVIADSKTFKALHSKYYIIAPECHVGGRYSYALELQLKKVNGDEITMNSNRADAISDISGFLKKYGVTSVFAYNASFDRSQLPELSYLDWYDIMRLAAYRQYNKKIPENAECCSTGRLRRDYGVEPILRMLTGNDHYYEKHNAVFDAMDELKIMRLLGLELEKYDCAAIGSNEKTETRKIFDLSDNGEAEAYISIFAAAEEEAAAQEEAAAETLNIADEPDVSESYDGSTEISIVQEEPESDISDSTETEPPISSPAADEEEDAAHEGAEVEALHIADKPNVSNRYDSYEYCTVTDVVEILGVSRSTVYNLIHRGEIPAMKVGNKYIMLRRSLADYIERRKRRTTIAIIISFLIMVFVLIGNCTLFK